MKDLETTLSLEETKSISDIHKQYATNGFCIFQNVISEEAMEKLRKDLISLIEPHKKENETIFDFINRAYKEEDQILYRLYQISTNLGSMNALRERCREFIHRHFDLENKPVFNIASHIIFCVKNDQRLTWSWHQESTYDNFGADVRGFNICIPVFRRASKENGTMSLLKGSHVEGELEYDKIKQGPNGSTTLQPKQIETYVAKYDEVHFEADPGDIVLFDRHLIHRSNRNTIDEPRITAVIQLALLNGIPDSLEKNY